MTAFYLSIKFLPPFYFATHLEDSLEVKFANGIHPVTLFGQSNTGSPAFGQVKLFDTKVPTSSLLKALGKLPLCLAKFTALWSGPQITQSRSKK